MISRRFSPDCDVPLSGRRGFVHEAPPIRTTFSLMALKAKQEVRASNQNNQFYQVYFSSTVWLTFPLSGKLDFCLERVGEPKRPLGRIRSPTRSGAPPSQDCYSGVSSQQNCKVLFAATVWRGLILSRVAFLPTASPGAATDDKYHRLREKLIFKTVHDARPVRPLLQIQHASLVLDCCFMCKKKKEKMFNRCLWKTTICLFLVFSDLNWITSKLNCRESRRLKIWAVIYLLKFFIPERLSAFSPVFAPVSLWFLVSVAEVCWL